MDPAVLNEMEKCWAALCSSDSNSLLKKYLTREVFDQLKNKKTTLGSTLLDCVQSGFKNHDSEVGIYAPDDEAYTVFALIFDPIIEDYHKGFKCSDRHPAKDWGDVNAFCDLDPECKYVISTRVQCSRSLECYPFSPMLSEEQFKEIECQVSAALEQFTCELKGEYHPLTGMCKHDQQKLIEDNILFEEGDRFLQAANARRCWPTGRGIFHNENKTFIVWCNEEDHLSLISMQKGGHLGEVYKRLVTAVNEVEIKLPFLHHDRLGFLTCCPTNLGTAICASVHIQLPKLACKKTELDDITGRYNLQVRDIDAKTGIFDISNKRRLGLTEYEAVKELSDGIKELICNEDQL